MFDKFFDVIIFCLKAVPRFVTLTPDEKGVVIRFGRYIKTLDEGGHYRFVWPVTTEVMTISAVQQLIDVPTQSLMTADRKQLHLDCSIEYVVDNPRKTLLNCEDHDKQLQEIVGDMFRQVVNTYDLSQCIYNMQEIIDRVFERVEKIADKEYGVVIIGILVPSCSAAKTIRLIQ
jgi:membrane protease subunit HflK